MTLSEPYMYSYSVHLIFKKKIMTGFAKHYIRLPFLKHFYSIESKIILNLTKIFLDLGEKKLGRYAKKYFAVFCKRGLKLYSYLPTSRKPPPRNSHFKEAYTLPNNLIVRFFKKRR